MQYSESHVIALQVQLDDAQKMIQALQIRIATLETQVGDLLGTREAHRKFAAEALAKYDAAMAEIEAGCE